jgi:glycosyltransferase involved in cell wall biosynthesis
MIISNCKKTLSIVIPIKNEIHYLGDLFTELNQIEDNDVEIVISDNYSDDGSWEFLKKHRSKIIKIVRPEKSCSPFENHKYALNQSVGKYVHIVGGDDIFLSNSLNNAMPLLRKYRDIIVIGRIEKFKDVTNEVTEISNNPDTIKSFFKHEIFSIKRYLHYVNYDEIIFSFVPRDKQGFINNLDPINYETYAVWSNFYNFYNRELKEIYFIDDTVVMKRFLKQKDAGNFNAELVSDIKRLNIEKFKGTIRNSFNFISVNFDLKVLIYLLFYTRKIIGSYGERRIYSPFVRVIRSELVFFCKKIF